MEKKAVDLDLAVSHKEDRMPKRVESMQKYIEVLEKKLELRNTVPFHVKRLVTENKNLKAEIQRLRDAKDIATIRSNFEVAPQVMENENLKAEIQTLQDAQEITSIKSSFALTPLSDLRNMINACKLRNVESIGDFWEI